MPGYWWVAGLAFIAAAGWVTFAVLVTGFSAMVTTSFAGYGHLDCPRAYVFFKGDSGSVSHGIACAIAPPSLQELV